MNTANVSFETIINAPKDKVWKTMLEKPTYEQWAAEFQVGSTYTGSWEQGSDISFVNTDGSGMFGKITECVPGETVTIVYGGMLKDGQLDSSPGTEDWVGAEERYVLTEEGGATHLRVEIGLSKEEFKAMFEDMWPRALAKLKQICEQ